MDGSGAEDEKEKLAVILEQTSTKTKKKSPKKSAKRSHSERDEEEEEKELSHGPLTPVSTTSSGGHYTTATPPQSTPFYNMPTTSEYSPPSTVESVPNSELTPPRSENEMSSQYYGLRLPNYAPYVSPYNGYGTACHQSNFPLTPPLSAGLTNQDQQSGATTAASGTVSSAFKEFPSFDAHQSSMSIPHHPHPLMGSTHPYQHHYSAPAHHHHHHQQQMTASESLSVFAANAQPFKMEPLN